MAEAAVAALGAGKTVVVVRTATTLALQAEVAVQMAEHYKELDLHVDWASHKAQSSNQMMMMI